jgi:hypothetical protein
MLVVARDLPLELWLSCAAWAVGFLAYAGHLGPCALWLSLRRWVKLAGSTPSPGMVAGHGEAAGHHVLASWFCRKDTGTAVPGPTPKLLPPSSQGFQCWYLGEKFFG